MALTQTVRVAVTLNPQAAGRDRFMNTWHIATRDATTPVDAADAFITDLNTFYQAIDAQLGDLLTGNVPLAQAYNLIELKPRQPIRETSLTTLTCSANRAARELAVCVSYRAEYQSGVTPKRRRGRIYIGPLGDGAISSSDGLVAAATVTALQSAANTLQAQSAASSEYAWVVYSPTTDVTGTGETGMYEVVSGWIDNSPDIQRRRGVYGGTKSTF
jgi:hypothetical protein